MINQDNVKELQIRIQAISNYLKINEKRIELQEAELKTQDPSFWDDPKKAEVSMKLIRSTKFWISTYDALKTDVEDLDILFDFFKQHF